LRCIELGSSLGVPSSQRSIGAAAREIAALFGERQTNGDIDETGNVIRSVFIKAPRNIGYGKVVKVIDAVKSSGADPLALQIDYLED